MRRSVLGQNEVQVSTGWGGMRFIGFNNTNETGWNRIYEADLAEIAHQTDIAAARNENIFLLGHHSHNSNNSIPLQDVLENSSIVAYMRGHSGSARARRGLSGVANPDVWDFNSNLIRDDGAMLYCEVFSDEIHVYVLELVTNPTQLPSPVIVPLVYALSPSSGDIPPVADFTGSPLVSSVPLSVQFVDKSSNLPTSWSWDFGDSSTSTDQHPVHTYSNPGTYDVSLTATNSSGSSTYLQQAFIVAEPPGIPSADFSASPRSGGGPLTVNFVDQSTGNPTSWSWDFGDGATSNQQNPTHTFADLGSYSVTLTATTGPAPIRRRNRTTWS